MTTPTVLVVGATGTLGSKIVSSLIQIGTANVKALVRPGKADQAQAFQEMGVIPVEGDLLDSSTLPQACQDVDAIIAAVALSDRSIVIEGQKNLIRAAEAAGVKRMIPSDYSVDYFKLDYGDSYNLDMRKEVAEALKSSKLQPTFVLNGAFLDMFLQPGQGLIESDGKTLTYWGDGEQLCDLTATDNVAAYTARAVLDPEMVARPLRVAGDVMGMKGIKAAYEAATGKTLTENCMGSVDDIKVEIDKRKKEGQPPKNYMYLQYYWVMFSGKGKLDPLDNQRYPDVQTTSVEDFFKSGLHQPVAAH